MSKNEWDITNRPHTKTKLGILRKYFKVWITIWVKQNWVAKEWYIMDLFAGKGSHIDKNKIVSGSPLIFLEEIANKKDVLIKNGIRIKLFFVEKKKSYFDQLKKTTEEFIKKNSQLKKIIKLKYFHNDCNKVTQKIIGRIKNEENYPLFILIDPWGLQIKKSTLKKLAGLKNRKDIMLNYMREGVKRVIGVIKKSLKKPRLNIKEIKTKTAFDEFIGKDLDVMGKTDKKILEEYAEVFTSNNLRIVAYDMKYPNRNDVLYYLLFASRKSTITDIIKDIFSKQKENIYGQGTLFDKEFYKDNILTFNPKIFKIERKSLLYKTKVEYGDWTINHIIGCMHGCNFPCYAMRMAQKFGWVKDYEDWRKPRIAVNAVELLEKEIPKYKNEIKHFVHLCFMSDPFMYDSEKGDLTPEIKELTLEIIERLNREGIKVTTLTKGFYPDEILDKKRFLQTNEYGITLVSLNKDFKKEYEPFSAPYEKRIESLKKLTKAGLRTWVSMEPYPTPKLPKLNETGAEHIEKILERIKFVKKIIFGKLNYSRLNYYNGNYSQVWENSEDFYKEMARKVINFCKKNNIKYHIKFGTPFSKRNTMNIFKKELCQK